MLSYDDEPGSWGRQSVGWPETPYSIGKWLLCTKANVVKYGCYVKVGNFIRVASADDKKRLEDAYRGMFIECRRYIEEELGNQNAHRN